MARICSFVLVLVAAEMVEVRQRLLWHGVVARDLRKWLWKSTGKLSQKIRELAGVQLRKGVEETTNRSSWGEVQQKAGLNAITCHVTKVKYILAISNSCTL